MADSYTTARIGDLADSISETHNFRKKRLIFLNTSDILQGKLLHRIYTDVDTWPGQAKKSIRKEDILLSEIRPANGRWAYVQEEADDFVVSTKLMVIRARRDRLFPKFLYQFLTSPEISRCLQHLAESRSGTFPQITFDQVASLEIPLPPLTEQRAIASVLGALDDKIELSRMMNETLEAMAQAFFQKWFVEPTQTGLPKGWCQESIYAAADVIYGTPFSSAKFNTEKIGKPLIRIRDLADENPEFFTSEEHPKGYLVKPGDIVVGMDGEFRAHLWGGAESWLNQRVCVFAPKSGFASPFVLNSIIGLLAEVEATETATTVIHIGKNDIDRFKIVVAPMEILETFNRATEPLFKRIVLNKQESRTLAALRDALLPKLLSGEMRVPSASKLVEANS